MLILAHSGITLAAALLYSAVSKSHFPYAGKSRVEGQLQFPSKVLPAPNPLPSHRASWFTPLANHIDIRILLVGSLLPDIIDKPLGQILFQDIFSSGRIFCHTLLFLLVISLAGIYLYQRRRKNWLLVLSFGTLMHLLLDQMWLSPKAFLWPLYGFAFPKADLSHWLGNILASLTMPTIYVPETIGALMLGIFLWQLIHSRALNDFILKGGIQRVKD